MSAGASARLLSRSMLSGGFTILLAALVGCPQSPVGDSSGDPGSTDTTDTGNKPDRSKAVITTIVGNGEAGDNGDGLPGTETALYLVQDMTVGPDGLLYIVDWNNSKLRRLLEDGTIETIAGTGEIGLAEDGPDARQVHFNHPTHISFTGEGNLLVAAWHNSLVKQVNINSSPYLETKSLCGTGLRSFNGDGLPALQTFLDLPSSTIWDPESGDIIFSDQANFRIRRLDIATGIVYTIAGDGTPAFGGDKGPATSAQLNSPRGQAAAPAGRIERTHEGDILVADTGNHVIRKIEKATGMITTIAGTPGAPGYAGDGGPALLATFNTPSDVAIGPDGSIYVADTNNHVVRKISPDGTITTVAGSGQRGFGGDGGPADEALLDRPYGVTVSQDGTLYIADTYNHRVRRVTSELPDDFVPASYVDVPVEIIPCTGVPGSICTWLGTGRKGADGDGTDRLHTKTYWPIDVEFLPNGRVMYTDWQNMRVREVLPDGTVRTVIGTGFPGDGPPDFSDLLTTEGADGPTVTLNHPTDIQPLPNGDVLIMVWHNFKLRVLDGVTGRVRVVAGTVFGFAGDGGPARDALIDQARSGVVTPRGDLFILDQRNQRIRVLYDFANRRENSIIQTVVGTGEKGYNGDGLPGLQTMISFQTGANPEPSGGIAYDPVTGDLVYADNENDIIRRVHFTSDDFLQSVVTTIAGVAGLEGYSGDGGPALGALLSNPADLEFGPDGNLYFADNHNSVIRKIDMTTGVITTVAGNGKEGYSGDGGPALEASLNRPYGVAFDPDGNLYITDTFNSRIRVVQMKYD
jgi:sugar lactone lactonase YvrE